MLLTQFCQTLVSYQRLLCNRRLLAKGSKTGQKRSKSGLQVWQYTLLYTAVVGVWFRWYGIGAKALLPRRTVRNSLFPALGFAHTRLISCHGNFIAPPRLITPVRRSGRKRVEALKPSASRLSLTGGTGRVLWRQSLEIGVKVVCEVCVYLGVDPGLAPP